MEKQTHILSGYVKRRHWSLPLMAAMAIILVAAAAIFALRSLTALYEKASRLSAAKSVIDQGAAISQWLADQPFFRETQKEGAPALSADRQGFDQAVNWLQKMERGVQSVAVSENGVILYQRQLEPTDNAMPEQSPRPADRTSIRRQKLAVGTNLLPVITFSRQQTTADGKKGKKRKLEIALNKAAIDRQSSAATRALNEMFYLALTTIAIAFAAGLLAIVALAHRETVWQRRIRLEEHLAFAGAVAGSVIHDFRNPLSAMRLDSQLLQAETARGDATRPERLRELAGRIVKTIDRIDALLAEFLALSRPEGNDPELFDINVNILDCVELLRLRFEKANIKLVVNLNKVPLTVSGFPAQFKRAMLNILTNAEQASPAAGQISIETKRESNRALIRITDEGPGIPPEERKKIFALFYSKRPGGTGIGLALAKTAIENCGGDIRAEAPAGNRGAAFLIRLPLSG